MAVKRFETILVVLPVAAGAAFLGYALLSTYRSYQARNGPAWAAGFSGVDDMEAAKKAGFTAPIAWRAELERQRAEQAAQVAKIEAAKAQMKAREDAAKEASNAKFQIAVRGAIALRESMKNPDSFKLERVVRMPDGSLCYTYRAANSFNAIIPGQAVFSPTQTAMSGSAEFPFLWSKHCKGYGSEVENVAYALTYYPRK